MRFERMHVVHPYDSMDTAAVWKKFRFILSDRSDFYMIDNSRLAHVDISFIRWDVTAEAYELVH